MKIDLNKLDDDLGGDWFHHIHTSNFGFLMKLSGIKNYEVEKDDIIIHKEIMEEMNFPTIKYNVIEDKGSHVADKNEVKEILGKNLVEYVKKNKKLPFACKFKKIFKNGAAQVDYNPSQYEKFPIKIVPKDHGISDLEEFFKDLKSEQVNPTKPQKGDKESGVNHWEIASSSDKSKAYTVTQKADGSFTCTCPQFVFRKTVCKHISECKN
ncbi:MAG: hypothetical protein ACTSPN_02600 [Promethearchaeota archaeon]